MKYFLIFFLTLLSFQATEAQQKQRILFFGDSITAGYGIADDQAFPALIQQKIDSLGWSFTVQNGGLSGETSAGGLRRIDWMLQSKVDVFVLELGGNDGLRGIDLTSTKENLQQIIEKVQQRYPEASIILAGMQVPPNLGTEYTWEFKKMYPALAQKNEINLIPFLLEGIGDNASLMQPDGLHPTVEGHRKIAEIVWQELKPILKKRR